MRRRKHVKPYSVGIPIPFLDRSGRKLRSSKVQKWTRLALKELTECFGGATAIPAPGTNIVNGKILYERGQRLVLSGCDDRDEFLAKRRRIGSFVEQMGIDLNQEAVFVLAFRSDSFLIEIGKHD